jgi:hypothetical protein
MNSARRDLLIASASLALLVASVEAAAGQTRLPPQTATRTEPAPVVRANSIVSESNWTPRSGGR